MMINEQDELLLQKCVDDQLSPAETRALLNRLNSIQAGWQTLACGLLEDRSLRKVLRGTAVSSTVQSQEKLVDSSLPPVSISQTTRDVVRHWWSHPMTSLTLCAAIAFVGGMLIPDLRPEISGQSPTVAAHAPLANSLSPAISQTAGNGPGAGGYRLQMQQGSSGVEIPVYDRLQELYQLDRNHPLFSELTNRQEKIRWMLVPVEDNKSMLIPVTEDRVSDIQ